jgi:parvulin-like peptidyl-prolyl isomerase
VRLGLAALMLLPLVLAGCSNRSKVLATVGGRTITVDEFVDVARRSQAQYPVPADSAKVMFLQDLLHRALLLEHAKSSGMLVDSLVRQFRKNVEDEALRNALFDRMVPRSIPVSEAEARQLYAWRDSVTSLQVIYAVDENIAGAAMAALRRGEDFSEVANRFNMTGALPPDGKLDFLAPGSIIEPLDGILHEGRPGQLIGPLNAPGEGWFIVRVLERKANPQEPFEQQELTLTQTLQQHKRRALSTKAFQSLRDSYHLVVDPEGVHFMFEYYNHLPGGGAIGDQGPPPPTAEQLSRVLARYDGGTGYRGTFTFADALQDLRADSRDRPNPSVLPSFAQWVESRAVLRVALLEARRRHLQEEPEIAKTIEERVDNYILSSVYDAEVVQRTVATDQDMRAAYERRAPSLVHVRSATIQHIVLPDSASAARVIERAKGARTLRDAILLASPGLRVREETVRYPSTDAPWAGLEGRFLEMSPGACGEPLQTGQGWMVYQLVSKQQEVPPYEALPAQVQQALRAEATEFARERRLAALTDSLRHVIRVREHRDRLKAIAWPVTAPRGATG